ncbi:MAG: hypothetical protein ACF8PN_17245 [Phycisphaerales bacterium]
MRMNRESLGRLCGVSAVGVALATALSAGAQYSSDFESVTGSAAGTVLTGQDGYYIPAGTNSVDFNVYTYAGNSLGVSANPTGGAQFVAGVGPGSPTFARAQRDMTWGTGVWRVSYDAAALYLGNPPSANNLGSFSVQPYPGSQSYIHLFSWVDATAATNWQAFYLAYTSTGSAHGQPGESPGAQWTNLELNKWYRFDTWLDFDQNQIVKVSITDLDTGDCATHNPSDWYLEGGSAGGSPTPTGFRFFGGGGVPDNVTAWDNYEAVADSVGDQLCLWIDGDCPGQLTATVTGATPGGNVAFVYGTNAGSFTNPRDPCSGTTIDIRPPFLPGAPQIVAADPDGVVSMGGNAPSSVCGRLLIQAVDLSTCRVSNLSGR